MKKETFVDKVKKQFGFLESNYGFKISFERNSDVYPQTDGIVKYSSKTTLLLIDSEAGQVAIRFLRIQDDERYYLDPVSIHEYLNTSESEKLILLSRDTKDKNAADAIFRSTFLLSTPDWKTDERDSNIDLEKQLKNYASWLNENAKFCLLGDFSHWPEFYEYKINRLIADELRKGSKDVVLAVEKNENGVFTTVKRPIFQREKEHLSTLRKEVLGE